MTGPRLTIIRGLPGSGKTTLGKILAKDFGAEYIDNDMWFGELYDLWSRKKNKYAIDWCKGIAARTLFRGGSVIVANTFVKLKYIDEYYEMAQEFDAEFSVLEPRTPWKFDPIACYHCTLHGVPLDHIKGMLDNWEKIPEGRYK
tara:strand:- start:260 stop:691 length:432 start_codon:yes stop_codon:yes gene_type:complete